MEFGFRAGFQLRWLGDQQQAKPQALWSLGLHPTRALAVFQEAAGGPGGRRLWHLSGAHPRVLPLACSPSSCTHTPVLQNHQTLQEQLPWGLCTFSPAGRQLAGLWLGCVSTALATWLALLGTVLLAGGRGQLLTQERGEVPGEA